jgi:hypothetical protein
LPEKLVGLKGLVGRRENIRGSILSDYPEVANECHPKEPTNKWSLRIDYRNSTANLSDFFNTHACLRQSTLTAGVKSAEMVSTLVEIKKYISGHRLGLALFIANVTGAIVYVFASMASWAIPEERALGFTP